MLKERDKKLLFYSWSYAFLAATLIYVCIGSGALAWDQVFTKTAATNQGNDYMTMISFWVNTSVTKVRMDTDATSWIWNCDGASGSETLPVYIVGSSAGNDGNVTVTWSMNGDSKGYVQVIIDDLAIPSGYENAQIQLSMVDFGGQVKCKSYYYQVADMTAIYPNAGFSNLGGGSGYNRWAGYPTGIITAWSGSDLPPAPVINDFISDASCYNPGEAIVLESNVTGSVDSWLWEIYDSSDTSVFSSTDSVETIVDEIFAPGLYQVQLYIENTGGNDFLSKEDWLNITQGGDCGPVANWTNPFPTQVTTVPTQQFYETMTMPPHIVTNMTGINAEIDKGIFANMSQGYRSYVDYVGEQANTTFVGTFRTLLSPVSLVVNAIAYAISLFSTSINALTVYTTVPLAITAIVINYMPWQIVTLITAGIAIDAILIIILGR